MDLCCDTHIYYRLLDYCGMYIFITYQYHLLWRRQWHPTPVLLPGKSHGWSSLVGCSPWGRKESDTTERLPFHFSLSWIGEGNGNPLQCSCLENPRDGGAWWAAVCGVAWSQTRLKRLSSSMITIKILKIVRGNRRVPLMNENKLAHFSILFSFKHKFFRVNSCQIILIH